MNNSDIVQEFREKFPAVKNYLKGEETRSYSAMGRDLESFLLEKLAAKDAEIERAKQEGRIETLEEVLSRKWEAYNEREAISPMGIVSVASSENLPIPTDANIRQLQYVKVWDIEKLLEAARAKNLPALKDS